MGKGESSLCHREDDYNGEDAQEGYNHVFEHRQHHVKKKPKRQTTKRAARYKEVERGVTDAVRKICFFFQENNAQTSCVFFSLSNIGPFL